MKNLIIYKENNIENIKSIKYYKDMNVNGILLDNFDFDKLEDLDKNFALAHYLKTYSLNLLLNIDILKIVAKLIDQDFTWSNPKFRKSFYQFINFLIKRGIGGFYFTNLEPLIDEKSYLSLIKEFSKNTINKDGIVSIVETSKNLEVLNFLSNPIYNNFSYVDIDKKNLSFIEYKKYIVTIQAVDKEKNINQLISLDQTLLSFTNTKNYPYQSMSLVCGISYFHRGMALIDNLEEMGFAKDMENTNAYKYSNYSNSINNYYKDILKYKKSIPALRVGTYRQIFINDPDIYSYIRTYENEKVLIFGNFSQKEILVDIRFHFLDLYDFSYLIGNYGRRRIVKNLLLRPYEFVAFNKDNKFIS